MEDSPFPGLNIASFDFLSGMEARERCLLCGRSRMFYCYNCFTALPSLASQLPRVKLPYKVHIIKHPGERCGKSTAVHAAVLAPEDVTIFTYPDIPEYDDTMRVALVFPGDNSVTLNDYLQALKTAERNNCPVVGNATSNTRPSVPTDDFKEQEMQNTKTGKQRSNKRSYQNDCVIAGSADQENSENQIAKNSEQAMDTDNEAQGVCISSAARNRPESEISDLTFQRADPGLIDIVVFIDSTWFQVHKISIDPRLSKLHRIELTSHDTKFWRPQLDKPSTYLSTIEAIYYCVREYHINCTEVPYEGQYDDLLFFFCYFYQKIKTLTAKTGKKLKAYHQERRKKPNTTQSSE